MKAIQKMASYFTPLIQLNEDDQETVVIAYEKSYDLLLREYKKQVVYKDGLYRRAVKLVHDMSKSQDVVAFSLRNHEVLDAFISGVIENIIYPMEIDRGVVQEVCGDTRLLH